LAVMKKQLFERLVEGMEQHNEIKRGTAQSV
jgi:hypothetical protein